VAGGVLSAPQFVQQFNNPSQIMQGIITSTYHLGCTFGALLTFFIGNHGRKKCIVFQHFTISLTADARVHNDDFGKYCAGFIIWADTTYIWSSGDWCGKWNEHLRYSYMGSRNVAPAKPGWIS
jgi:hypothetical protein